ncbi:MAG: hypothetical protein H0U04_13510 [Rubrobacter sp.]|nr:hypothetical protein [Rubrobacter sp.]
MDVRYLTDENGVRVGVLLEIKEYERMVEELEELADIRAYDEVETAIERGEDNPSPLKKALPRIEREREELRRKGVV